MKFLATVLAIFAILSLVLGSNVFEKDFSNTEHPGKCYIRADLILDPGRHNDPGDKCISYDCKENGKGTMFVSAPIGCTEPIGTPRPPQ